MEDTEKQTIPLPNTGRSKMLPIFFIFGLFLFFAFAGIFSRKAFAATAPAIVTYQGKLLVANHLATSTQSIYFILYDAPTGGSALYSANGTTGSPLPISVTPVQGLFSINLGDVGTNSLDPAIFQNNGSVYLEVRIGSDILSPRKRITSVPYAFNAKYLDGMGVSTLSSTAYIPRSDSSGNFTFNSTTIATSTITSLTVLGNASLGTVTVGTWNGSVISPVYGGTGQNSSAWTGFVKVTAGTWSTTSSVSLATDVNGVLSITNGGTNATTLGANGSIIYSDGVRYNASAVGTAGQILQSTGSGAPVWVPTSSLGFGSGNYSSWTLATSSGDIGYSVTSGVKVVFSGINGLTTTRSGSDLSIGLTNSGVVAGTYGSASAVPVLVVDSFGRVVSGSTTTIAINANQVTSGTISSVFGGTGQNSSAWTGLIRVVGGVWGTSTVSLASDVTGVLPILNGGTNTTTLGANGSIIYSNGTSYAASAVGTAGQILQSTGSGAPVWVPTSSLGFGSSNYTSWTLATSTSDIGYAVTSSVKVVFSGINGLTTTRSGSDLSIGLTNSGVVAGTYGSASAVPIITVDSFGRITSQSTTTIAINGNQITSGTVSPVFGGTGQNSSGWTGLVRVTAGVWATTTVNLATDVNGVLSIAQGGTNTSTLGANGSIIYSNGTSYAASAVGTAGQILQSTGSGAPVWVPTSSLGFASGNFVNLLATTPGSQQTGNFNISGTGIIGTSFGIGTSTVSSTLTIQGGNGLDLISVVSSTGSSIFKILADGRVGINSSTPSASLSITGAGSVNPFTITSSSGASLLQILANGNIGIGTSTPTQKLSVVGNISNLVDSRTVLVEVATTSVGDNPTSVFVSGKYAYVANASANTMSIVDVTNPASPIQIGTASVGNLPFSVYVSGRYAYVANYTSNNISVVDISNPALPVQVSTVAVGTSPQTVYVSGRYAYVANSGSDSISVVDISNPLAPVQIATASVGVAPASIYVSGRYAYVANYTSNTISVVDISNPASPTQVSAASVGTGPYDIKVSGRYAYVLNYTAGTVSVVDISNPLSPSVVATYTAGDNPDAIFVSGRYLYFVKSALNSLSVVDISNPVAPVLIVSTTVGLSPASLYVSGRYAYVGNSIGDSISVVDISGAEVSSLIAHSAEVGNLQTRNDIFAQGNIMAGTSLLVGTGGIMSNGALSIFASSTGATSSIFSISSSASSSIFKVFANGKIGINSSSPFATLSVNGDIAVTGGIYDSTGTRGTAGQILQTNGTAVNWVSTSSLGIGGSSGTVGSGLAGQIAYYAVDGTGVVGTSSLFVSSSGNIGINTTTPSSRLTIVGSASSPILDIFTSVGSSTFRILSDGRIGINSTTPSASLTVQGVGSVNPFAIASSSGASLVQVLTNGNVGIGTSTPTQKLSVVGNISNIIDASTTISVVTTTAVVGAPRGIFVSGRYAYVTTQGSTNNFQIFDVSNIDSPAFVASTTLGTGALRSVYVSGQYAYVTNNASGLLHVVDISNPFRPTQVASTSVAIVPETVVVSGRYAYVANTGLGTMVVVDISNPRAPVQVSTVSPGGSFDIQVVGRYAYVSNISLGNVSIIDISNPSAPVIAGAVTVGSQPQSIAVSGRYMYVANKLSDTISVVDVSNASTPAVVSTVSLGTGANPNSISVSGRYVYTGNSNNTVSIVDVANPSAARLISNTSVGVTSYKMVISGRYAFSVNNTGSSLSIFDISGAEVSNLIAHSAEFGNIQTRNDIFAQGNIMAGTSLQVGVGGIMSQGALSVFASSTGATSSIFSIASIQTPNAFKVFANGAVSINTSSASSSLTIQASSTFSSVLTIVSSTGATLVKVLNNGNVGIGTSTPTQRLSVVGNISNIVDVSTTISLAGSAAVGTSPFSVFVSGKYAYVANSGSNNISVVDVTNPSSPVQISTTSVEVGPRAVFVSGKYAYVANSTSNTISIVDVSNPRFPVQIATTTTGVGITQPNSLYVSGKYAYVANTGNSTLGVIDVSNPYAPVLVASVSTGGSPIGINVSGRYAYVANLAAGTMGVYDIANPNLPVLVSTITLGSQTHSAYVSGRYAYVTNYTGPYLSVVDISNPAAPVEVGSSTAFTNPRSVFVSGRYAYVADYGGTSVKVVDVSNPSVPTVLTTLSLGVTPYNIFVSGRYAYTANNNAGTISIIDISGTEVSSLIAHSAEVGNLQARNDIFAQGNIMAGTSLSVGVGGIMSQGALSVFASSTGVSSSIFSIASPQVSSIFKAFTNGSIGIGTTTASSTLTIQGVSGSLPLFTIASSTGSTLVRVLANGNLGVGTSTPTQKLSVVGNISNIIDSNTAMSVVATTSVSNSPSSTPYSVFVSGRYAYVANNASNTISVIDVSNPAGPVQIATTSVGSGPQSISVSGRYAYVANSSGGTVSVVDVSNPRAPRQVGVTATISSGAETISVSGRYAYVVGNAGVAVVDVANPLAPVEISNLSLGTASINSIYVSGRYAYLGGVDGSQSPILVVDISNPSVLSLVATTTVDSYAQAIYVSGRYAYTANLASGTMSVVDISNPAAPVQVATTSVGTQPHSIYVSGRYAFIANLTSHTISVVDVSSSTAPVQITTIPVSTYPESVFVSGRYAYVVSAGSSVFSVIDISGTEVSSLIAHSAEVGNFQSRNDIFAQGNIMAGTSLLVGAGGIMSQGTLSIFASSTGATSSIFNISSAASSSIFKVFANGKVGIGTSTFSATSTLDVQGQVEVNLTSPVNATFALCHSTNGATDNQVIYDCSSAPQADYMEMYAADVELEMGDVVAFSNNFVTTADGNSIPKLSKSTAAYQAGLVGVISDPTQAGDFNSIGHNVADEDNPLPLALSGRIKIKVTNVNGDIHVGDKLTSSNIPGVAMKATGEGPTIAIAMGDYTSAAVGTVMGFVNLNWNNTLYQALTLDVNSQTLSVGNSTSPHNLTLSGNLSLSNNNLVNKLAFASSTLFESSVASASGARAFTFNAINFSGPLADNYIISLRANNNSVFSVAANGDVHALGNYYGASAIFGTSTNPGDLAERVDIAADDSVEAGDVVMVDGSAPDTYRRSSSAYEESVAGVISTNPTIVVGNGRTDYTAVMAMVGRVPVKVSSENGAITRGDLLVAASLPGYAMKYDAATDINNKMVGVIGVALESLPASSTGKILALIRTGWVYNRDKDIDSIQGDIERLATASGINLDSDEEPGDLTVENTNNQLMYTGGNLDLQNNALVNVAMILGKNNKWKIDEFGNLIQRIVTATGEKEIYGLQSTGKQEIVISGTSTLENGMRRVVLAELDQAIIDHNVPLKISITMSGETNGYYVSERNFDSFVVKENGNGQSNAPFDWIVIAKVLPAGAAQSNPEPENTPPTTPVNPESVTPSSSPEVEEPENSAPTSTPEPEPQPPSESEQNSIPTTTP